MSRPTPDRSGIAIVTVLLIMLALTMLAHGLLMLTELEVETSRAGAASVQARLAAQAATQVLVADSGSARRARTPVWGASDSVTTPLSDSIGRRLGLSVTGGTSTARLVRLSRELWLAEARARIGTLSEHRAARPVWIADAAARVAELPAVVVDGAPDSTAIEGRIDASAFYAEPTVAPPGSCAAGVAGVDSIRSSAPAPVSFGASGALGPALGRLPLDSLARRAPVAVTGAGTPGPRAAGAECLRDEPWNWGDPGRPSAPCGPHLAVVVADSGLAVEGGVGQGVLVLSGAATLTDVTFYGVVLARGPVELLGATRIEGVLLAGGGVRVGPSAQVVGSACWAVTALAHGVLRTPSPVPDSGWLDGR